MLYNIEDGAQSNAIKYRVWSIEQCYKLYYKIESMEDRAMLNTIGH